MVHGPWAPEGGETSRTPLPFINGNSDDGDDDGDDDDDDDDLMI